VDAAVEEYMNTPKQPVQAMFDFLFERLPKHLQEQREQARRYASQNGKHGAH
jgi:TPP-dependent pyruvate/acetoin dehydrogenase alpha subunit